MVSLNTCLSIFAKKASSRENNLVNEDSIPTILIHLPYMLLINMNFDTLDEHGPCILCHWRKRESYVKFTSF